MLHRIALILLIGLAACFAQEPAELLEKAPPGVDETLRARISSFYQAHVDGKFRLAYDLVADDSKDLFLAANKERYSDFSILRIEYSENFTKAKAVVACGQEIVAMGNRFQMKAPMASTWKVVDGQWYWYTVLVTETQTPFGVMRPGPKVEKEADLARRAPRVEALRNLVKVDKTEVKLSLNEPSSDQVTVSNHLPGAVSLSIEYPQLPGLEVKLDHVDLNAQETATVAFRFDPSKKGPRPLLTAWLKVAPINQVIPIRIAFFGPPQTGVQPPPKPERQLPRSAPPLPKPVAPAAEKK